MTPDFFNGLFELGGAAFALLNVRRAHLDREVKGVSWVAVLFFAGWGYWNVYYYPTIEQPFSAACAVVLALVNSAWVIQLYCYDRRK